MVIVPLMWILLSRRVGRLDDRGVLLSTVRTLVASAAVGAVAYALWTLLRGALGTSLPAQVIEVGVPVAVAAVLYLAAMHRLRVPEAGRIVELLRHRGREAPA